MIYLFNDVCVQMETTAEGLPPDLWIGTSSVHPEVIMYVNGPGGLPANGLETQGQQLFHHFTGKLFYTTMHQGLQSIICYGLQQI